jgi:hypothetical protein
MLAHRVASPRVLALALAAFPLGACSTSSQPAASPSLDDSAPPGKILLTVDNRNAADARLYVVRPGLRHRLGTIGSYERRTFALSTMYLGGQGEIALETELMASRERHRMQPVSVVAGDRLEWMIGLRLPNSWVRLSR